MDIKYGVLAIVIICVIILIIGSIKQKSQLLLNFLVRAVLGMISIYFVNSFLESQNINMLVGINPISAVTVGILGISGFVLLYGIMLYQLL